MGSFQTMMIHGRSGSTTLSVSGVSSLTGAVIVSGAIVLYREHSVLSPGPLDRFPFRVDQPFRDDLARVRRVDQVVEERPPRRDVRADLRAHGLDHLVALRVALLFRDLLQYRAADDVHRSFRTHHADLSGGPA